jgi:hypothetical protein
VSAYTYTFDIKNEYGSDVTSEITFTSNNEQLFTTGGTNGRVLTAVASGTTSCNLVHIDYDPITHPGASGVTNVIVGTIIVDGDFGPIISGATIYSNKTYDISTNWTSNGQILPFNISSYSVSEQIATLDLTGIITPTATGTTIINITDEASGFESSTGFSLKILPQTWDYEANLVVGTDGGTPPYIGFYGGSFGSLTPNPDPPTIKQLFIYNTTLRLKLSTLISDLQVQIDGSSYTFVYQGDNIWKTNTINPFKAVGETSVIKMNYTIVS